MLNLAQSETRVTDRVTLAGQLARPGHPCVQGKNSRELILQC